MAEYIRYKGERYKKVDSENEKSERVDTLEQRIEKILSFLNEKCNENRNLDRKGRRWKYRLASGSCVFVLSEVEYYNIGNNTAEKFGFKLATEAKRIAPMYAMAFVNHKVDTKGKSDLPTCKFVIVLRIKNPLKGK